MKRGSVPLQARHLALVGLIFLAGCPSAADFGSSSSGNPVAGFQIVQGIQGGTLDCRMPGNSAAMVQRVLELVNQERERYGLQPLTLNPILCKMAEDYACQMIEQSFFDHIDPEGNGPGHRAMVTGYVFESLGENLAGGQASPEQVVSEWMASTEGHRENILAVQWREIGIGVRTGGQYGVYWVQEFGAPPPP